MNTKTQAQGFDRAMGEAKKQASNVADAANNAARKTASSFETAVREIIENQPYIPNQLARVVCVLKCHKSKPLRSP